MLAIVFGIIVTIIVMILFKGYYENFKRFLELIITFAITTIFVYGIIINIEFFKNIISRSNYPIYDKFALLLTSMSIAILLDGVFSNIIQKIYEKIIVNKYEKQYKTQKYEYYREILQTKSPAILSYCYDRKINVEDEVVAIFLNLKRKKIIDLKDKELIITDNVDELKKHEKYALKNIQEIHENKKKFNDTFKSLLYEDLEQEKYVYKKSNEEVNIISIMEMFMIWMIIYISCNTNFYGDLKYRCNIISSIFFNICRYSNI